VLQHVPICAGHWASLGEKRFSPGRDARISRPKVDAAESIDRVRNLDKLLLRMEPGGWRLTSPGAVNPSNAVTHPDFAKRVLAE
jgi:hypothetical protein